MTYETMNLGTLTTWSVETTKIEELETGKEIMEEMSEKTGLEFTVMTDEISRVPIIDRKLKKGVKNYGTVIKLDRWSRNVVER